MRMRHLERFGSTNCLNREILPSFKNSSPRVFIQIGAEAGDQDARAYWREGFTEFVKSLSLLEQDRIILVEPNPLNISALQKAWAGHSNIEILQLGVVPNDFSDSSLEFWYAEEDAPHYQVFSLNKEHVSKHYPQGTFRSIEVKCKPINSLLNEIMSSSHIALLAIDSEGIDGEILQSIDRSATVCDALSFESIHPGVKEDLVVRALKRSGLIPAGGGLDVNGYDRLFIRPTGIKGRIMAFAWELSRRLRSR
jgi:FkbM family methyltransferase